MKNTSKNTAKALPLLALAGLGTLVGVHSATGAPGDGQSKVSITQEQRSEAIPMALLHEGGKTTCSPGENEKVLSPGKDGVRQVSMKVTRSGDKVISQEKVGENIKVTPQAKHVQDCDTKVSRSSQRQDLGEVDPKVIMEILSATPLSLTPGNATKVEAKHEEKHSTPKASTAPKAEAKKTVKPTSSPKSSPTEKAETTSAPKESKKSTVKITKDITPSPSSTAQIVKPQATSTPSTTTPTVTATSTVAPVTVTGTKADWMQQAGISPSDYAAVDYIVFHESGWNYKAVNPSSGAYGLCQALPGIKMASAGADWATNPITQLKWCSNYATVRYHGWQGAMAAWQIKHWW